MSSRRPLKWIIVGAMLSGSTACKQPGTTSAGRDGGPYPTQGMFLHVVAEDVGGYVKMRAVLNSDPKPVDRQFVYGNKFELDGGDALEVCAEGRCVPFSADRDFLFGSILNYGVSLPIAAGNDYSVAFRRPAATSALGTRVHLPGPFDILEPMANQVFSDGDIVRLAWSLASGADSSATELQVNCQFSNAQWINDFLPIADTDSDGVESVAVADLLDFARRHPRAPTANASILGCQLILHVLQERYGSIDPAFAGGEAVGLIRRSISWQYAPLASSNPPVYWILTSE